MDAADNTTNINNPLSQIYQIVLMSTAHIDKIIFQFFFYSQ